MKRWLQVADIRSGPIFHPIRNDEKVMPGAIGVREVNRIYKHLARRLGISETEISGHSTRIGGAHDLVSSGKDIAAVMQAGGWQSPLMPTHYTRKLLAKRNAMAQFLRRARGRA